jgi:hypothetical protein
MIYSSSGFALVLKKLSRDLPIIRRHLAISSHDQVNGRRLKSLILALMVKQKKHFSERVQRCLKIATVRYLSLVLEPPLIDPEDATTPRKNLLIKDFSLSDCNLFYRFKREHLYMLFELLQIPHMVWFKNGSKMRGEEVFLRALYELAGGENQHKISKVFGGDHTLQSRTTCWFVEHVYEHFEHLLHDNLDWFMHHGFFEESARHIGEKMGDQGQGNMMAFFIDCNCLPCSVTGGGPAEKGANAARWSDAIQRAFYNGWKSVHGLKHQTVDIAHGLTVDLVAAQRSDAAAHQQHSRSAGCCAGGSARPVPDLRRQRLSTAAQPRAHLLLVREAG